MRATIDWPNTDAATDEADGGLRPGRVGPLNGQTNQRPAATERFPDDPLTTSARGFGRHCCLVTPACGPRSYHNDGRPNPAVPVAGHPSSFLAVAGRKIQWSLTPF
jgi:hypothetical protein